MDGVVDHGFPIHLDRGVLLCLFLLVTVRTEETLEVHALLRLGLALRR